MRFTFKEIEKQYSELKEMGYHFFSIASAFQVIKTGNALPEKCVLNRVDVDFNLRRAKRLGEIFKDLEIPASFYIRLHSNEYNPNSFENFSVLSWLKKNGFEIGYHSEITDAARIFDEPAEECLRRDLSILSAMLGQQVKGIASHGGLTGLNNLDFWQSRKPAEFGCDYEAYDPQLFKAGLYVSDSEWTQWKSYRFGERIPNCLLSPVDHGKNGEPYIYLLIHSDTYFDHHIYEA